MRSILARLMIMSVATAVLTTFLSAGILHTQPQPPPGEPTQGLTQSVLASVVQTWQLGDPIEKYNNSPMERIRGYILDQNEQILYTYGETPCTVGMAITICHPDIDTLGSAGKAQRHADDHITWTDAKQALRMGGWVVVSYRDLTILPSPSVWSNVVIQVGLITLLAFPISFLLSFVTARPLARRLRRIAQVSNALAQGNLDVRTGETTPDEIGQLGANFDQMANVMSQQVVELRQLVEENSSLVQMAEKMARAAERTTLSRDLHDSISQHLFSLAMGTSTLATFIHQDPLRAEQDARQLALIAEQAQDEFRATLSNLRLRSSSLHRGSLNDALTEWITVWRKQYALKASVQFCLGNDSLPLLVEEVLFRACQEGLNNVARHAHASEVTVLLKQEGDRVLLEVTDNGQGFDPTGKATGLGLIGLEERVRAVGGTVSMGSSAGTGTQLRVQVPLAKKSTEGKQ